MQEEIIYPIHNQVLFETKNGVLTEVDEGIVEILTSLRRLGVETHWSCEGDAYGGYFVSDLRSAIPFLVKLFRTKPKQLSSQARLARRYLLRGAYEIETRLEKDHGQVILLQHKLRIGDRDRYALEFDLSNTVGARLVVRWPSEHTELMRQLLSEL